MRGGKGKPGDECRKRLRPDDTPAHAVQQQPSHRLGSAFLFIKQQAHRLGAAFLFLKQ